jgi:hypothetical protein
MLPGKETNCNRRRRLGAERNKFRQTFSICFTDSEAREAFVRHGRVQVPPSRNRPTAGDFAVDKIPHCALLLPPSSKVS